MSRDETEPRGLTDDELARYSRHLTLPEVGLAGQRRLRDASVLIVGAGGLGSPLALYLAAAGVGRLGIVDPDRVDRSNLQRQVLYDTADIGQPKVGLARRRVEAINPGVEVDAFEMRLDASNAMGLIEPYDVVVDGTDNFPTRFLINDACVLAGKPDVYGSIFRFEGQVSVFWSPRGPCYRCLYPEPPPPGAVPNCAEGGVLGVLPGVIGALQANEAIKLILGAGEPLIGRLLLFDALELRFRELLLRRDPGCPVCGEHPTIRELSDLDPACALDGQALADEHRIAPIVLRDLLARGDRPVFLDVRGPAEWALGRLAGARTIPLSELPERMHELDPATEIVVYCHLGARSARAVRLLLDHGFARTRNLEGGIDAWSREVDPSLPRY